MQDSNNVCGSSRSLFSSLAPKLVLLKNVARHREYSFLPLKAVLGWGGFWCDLPRGFLGRELDLEAIEPKKVVGIEMRLVLSLSPSLSSSHSQMLVADSSWMGGVFVVAVAVVSAATMVAAAHC